MIKPLIGTSAPLRIDPKRPSRNRPISGLLSCAILDMGTYGTISAASASACLCAASPLSSISVVFRERGFTTACSTSKSAASTSTTPPPSFCSALSSSSPPSPSPSTSPPTTVPICRSTRCLKCPFFAMSPSYVPSSTTSPASNTQMRSARRTVERRWAMTIVVRPSIALSSACCTILSDEASRADVASSNSITQGLRRRARAMAIRCFCPPDSWAPFSPTFVPYFCVRVEMKEWAFAFFAASITSSSVAVGRPNRMLSMMLPSKRVGSWDTMAICSRIHFKLRWRTSTPSNFTLPDSTSYRRWMRDTVVLFPHPE
mmetsp:Transcript_11466/g.30382  ORF Transcript_11466/g.30382 Transcript_11466/m.30382 type:complete len:316 (+) Transcript_11466:1755-2702(+)